MTKNGEEALLPLRPETVELLRSHLATMLPTATVFTLPYGRKGAKMLRVDLLAARSSWLVENPGQEEGDFLQYESTEGTADFHCLRHSFITNLARSGVHPSVAQKLARHSDINLTLGRYTHTALETAAEAIACLPAVESVASVNAATGTDDITATLGAGKKAPEKAPFQGTKIGVSCHARTISTDVEKLGECDFLKDKIAENAYTVTTKTPLSSSDKGAERGTPERIRTPNLLIRSQVLYPIELQAQ